MYDVSCKLLSYTSVFDDIGNEKRNVTEVECPIVRVVSVGQNEFYNASQQGLKPNLKIIISAINYNDESELIYMGNKYTILRTTLNNDRKIATTYDEIALICEKRVRDVKES